MSDQEVYDNILVFSDLHAPAMHPDAVDFLKAVDKEYGPFDKVICNGDLVDFHACARHDASGYLPRTVMELESAIEMLQPIFKLFPDVDMTAGNHDVRVAKKCEAEGIPLRFLKRFEDALDMPPGWRMELEFNVPTRRGPVKFIHDAGCKLIWKAISIKGMHLVQGHRHTLFEIQHVANENNLYWGMTSGCLIDHKHLAFNYARTSSGTDRLLKPIIGCGIIQEGKPYLIPMVLDKGGRWTRKL